MIMSMTGFGRGSTVETGRSFVIEIKSVNHRYLDLNIKMPKSLISLEDRIRDVIKGRLKRGKVDVFVTQKIFERDNVEAVLDKSLADSYIKCLNEIRDSYSLRDDISVVNIARFPDVISIEQKEEDFDEIWNIIKNRLIYNNKKIIMHNKRIVSVIMQKLYFRVLYIIIILMFNNISFY